MLYTKFRENRPAGSGEDFLRVLTIYGHCGHLGHVTWTIYTNFGSLFQRRLHITFGYDSSSSFRGENMTLFIKKKPCNIAAFSVEGKKCKKLEI